jgi:hypothetical protein
MIGWPVWRLWRGKITALRFDPVIFWGIVGTTASLPGIAAVLLTYEDIGALRYAVAAMWWPSILGAGLLLTLLGGVAGPVSEAVLALVSIASVVAALHGQVSFRGRPLMSYPIAACIRSSPEMAGLRTGLAEYWVARPLQAASDWNWQVDQIFHDGAAEIWGNDRWNYARDLHDPTHPPHYQFIVLANLDIPSIRSRYGAPDRVVRCPTTDIWIYDSPTHLHDILVATSHALLFPEGTRATTICVPPALLSTVGKRESDGSVIVATEAQFDAYASWGPYIDLPAGNWTISLIYRLSLSSSGVAGWDTSQRAGKITLDRGNLGSTGDSFRSVAAVLESEEPIQSLEVRIHVKGAGRLEVAGLQIREAGVRDAIRCEFADRRILNGDDNF